MCYNVRRICPIYLREKRLRSLDELARQADAYLVARNRQVCKSKLSTQGNNGPAESNGGEHKTVVCFKCNETGHRAADCKTNIDVSSDVRCFKCRKVGHKAEACPMKPLSTRAASVVVVAASENCSREVSVSPDCDIRAEVCDGKLQLASGKSVPVVTNCGVCGDIRPIDELRLPIMRGFVGDKPVEVLRDTGCDGVVVRRDLVSDDQLTGRTCLIAQIDNTMLLAK
ncbi:hypothetical protein EGW08_008758 [Elysia chlorotica]|uniref:CCHC-type domain-containing protein n=1 Tax=Elysia chlorotica TaxID=188477 RepID=A0A3S1HPC9_ELYCH|nr:hypothetical protein EGW08_008758 [Elysia chlorotica]